MSVDCNNRGDKRRGDGDEVCSILRPVQIRSHEADTADCVVDVK